MNEFLLEQGTAEELLPFPHIKKLGIVKNPAIRLNTFHTSVEPGVHFLFIMEGSFQWHIHKQPFTLYPGDLALILPGQEFGSANNVLEIGSYLSLQIDTKPNKMNDISLGKWTRLSANEINSINKILLLTNASVIVKFADAGKILKCIQQELCLRELGHCSRVNNQLDELFILTTRQLSKQSNPGRDFSKTFMKLEEALRDDLTHQWVVEEMAAFVGLGTTLFNEKVKSYSGFSPLNYLIKIRISEAIKLLKKQKDSITDIALETGFSSSQHFSTTFKKLTGYTPGEFRKKNTRND